MTARLMLVKQGYSLISGLMFILLLMAETTWAADSNMLTINSGSSAPMIVNDNDGFYPQLIHALFKRLKIPVRTLHMPSSSSLKSVNDGIHDGLIARIGGVDKKYPNLVPVLEKVIDLRFTAYSNDTNIKITKWSDLAPYNVAYIRGWKIYDKKVKLYKSLVKVKKPDQLFRLLKRNRADVVLYQNIPARYLMRKLNYFPHEHFPYLDEREMFIYMHKRHKLLVSRMGKELKEMKKDGSYKKLYTQYISNIVSASE